MDKKSTISKKDYTTMGVHKQSLKKFKAVCLFLDESPTAVIGKLMEDYTAQKAGEAGKILSNVVKKSKAGKK